MQASLDEAHEGLSGPATKRILEREHAVYGKQECKHLAGILLAHIYNLRKREDYGTPYEKLRSLENGERHLKEGLRHSPMEQRAMAHSDTAFVHQMQKHKQSLLARARAGQALPPGKSA